MARTEAQIQAEILIRLGEDFPKDVRAWRNNSGAIKVDDRFICFGLKGQADISGLLITGRRLEIEVKSAKGRQSKDQKNFEQMITDFQGIYILAKDYYFVKKSIEVALRMGAPVQQKL